MAHKEIPLFDNKNYVLWSKKMKAHLMSLGFYFCDSVVNGYKIPKNHSTYLIERMVGEYNAKVVMQS